MPRAHPAADALLLLLRALGLADEQIPGDVQGRAPVYRSLLRDRHALVVLDNAGSEEQVRPLLPGNGASRGLITARRRVSSLIADPPPGAPVPPILPPVNGFLFLDRDKFAVSFAADVPGKLATVPFLLRQSNNSDQNRTPHRGGRTRLAR
jgi:hypothetical protein